MSDNNVIGKDNKLPWHLPGDLKYFKKKTLGKPIIMGRKTFESLKKPLPGRTNIVVTQNANYSDQIDSSVKVAHSIPEALKIAGSVLEGGEGEIMIIGGGLIYKDSLHYADRLYITKIHDYFEGDAFFPTMDLSRWKQVSCIQGGKDLEIPPFDFCVYERQTKL